MAETKAQSAAPADSTAPAAEVPQPVLKGAGKQDEGERGPKFAVAYGMSGANVADLQTALNKKLDKGSQLEVDGTFGDETAAAVKAWQRQEGFAADASVDAVQAQKLGF
jgi:peptidoglycan hydrolase-like protein with peptidoglycan-binding domain